MKEIKWSVTNDPTVWENDDAGVIRFASEEDAQKMMRFLAALPPEVATTEPTPEMIQAGVWAMEDWQNHRITPDSVAAAYRAMEKVRCGPQKGSTNGAT